MHEARKTCGLAAATIMMLSSITVLLSQNATAAQWLTATDADFAQGNFFTGMGFETELHGFGVDAYVQNKKDMTNWIQKFPGTDTGPRSQFGFANDSQESRFILFGGLDGISMWRNDTWEYNYASNNWEQICADDTPACGPPKRIGASMAYDNNSKVVVMYGGYSDQGQALADTWEYSVASNTWTNITPVSSPRGMMAHKMVYDAKDKVMILYGQVNQPSQAMELWAYDAATNLWTNKNPSGGPGLRSGFAFGYSYQATHQRAVFFGGGWMMDVYDDTWEYNYAANSWTQISPAVSPAARSGASMTYNFKPSITGLILWGGNTWTTETWRYYWDVSTPTWAQITVTTTPTPRQNHGLAYDPGHNALMIYGGEPFSGPMNNDTWFLEAGYRLEGKYASGFFNTFNVYTTWSHIFWNQTPASVPPNTQIRMQVNASNVCDEMQSPVWRGPDGTSGTYYTIPGTALWAGNSGNKCIRFLADMITTDPSVAPMLEDVTLDYAVDGTFELVSYSPTLFNNQLDAPIYLNFSMPADRNNVFVSVYPNVTLDTPWNWYESDSKAKITHNTQPFTEYRKYDICVWAINLAREPLPGGKKCWIFTTAYIPPVITVTNPPANQVDVPLDADITVTFSEPMNTSTCWPYVTIDHGAVFDNHAWSNGNTTLTMMHSSKFTQFTTYTVEVPVGDPSKACEDAAGVLLTFGLIPNQWPFTTTVAEYRPYIIWTDPAHAQLDVPVNKVIKATFSKDMNQSSLSYAFKEYNSLRGWENWTGYFNKVSWAGRTVSFIHDLFFGSCKPYKMQIWALDTTGRALTVHPWYPNPWAFMTTCGTNFAPYMVSTDPPDGATDVPLWKNITIRWWFTPPDTGGMVPSSFTFSIKDSWGNEISDHFTANWSGQGNSVVVLEHPGFPFNGCEKYTVKVLTARDTSGKIFIPGFVPNPFSFWTSTDFCPPYIAWMDPKDGDLNVGLDEPIRIKFSEPMDMNMPPFFFDLRPDASPYAMTWYEIDSNVSIQHSRFQLCTWYNMTVFGFDKDGWSLTPGPYQLTIKFRTVCSPTYIVETYPAYNQIHVSLTSCIYVNFSEPMDPASLVFSLIPFAGTATFAWFNNNKTVRICFAQPFVECTIYTATVVSARNQSGGPIVPGPVPNPWSFRTDCCKGYIVYTIPQDGALGVGLNDPVVVHFSCPVDKATFWYSIIPMIVFDTITWLDDATVRLEHSQPFMLNTVYTITVGAKDLQGNVILPGPVPNPWSFSTECLCIVRGLRVERSGSDVMVRWIPAPSAQYYRVFHSIDKSAPWPWVQIGNVTTNYFLHANAIADMQNHFYIVRSVSYGFESPNSTMGALWHLQLSPVGGMNSAMWLSLPYRTIYKKASSIAIELGCGKINLVAKWDASRDILMFYYCLHNQWRGLDFSIRTGEAIMIGIKSSFDWAVNGTDGAVTLTFTYSPVRHNYCWVSLPYTGNLISASGLVSSIAGGLGPGTNTRIDAVGKWNYSRQDYDFFRYTPTGWSGVDFLIMPGDGIWIEIVSTFSWSPDLITPEVP